MSIPFLPCFLPDFGTSSDVRVLTPPSKWGFIYGIFPPRQGKRDEVIAKQPDMEELNEKAQALLETNTDARVAHTSTQLATKYQALLTLVKVN